MKVDQDSLLERRRLHRFCLSVIPQKEDQRNGEKNRKVKNNVFVDLFYEDKSAEANIISLYNTKW